MDIADMLRQSGALNSVAGELGIDPATAAAGATALLPAILGGFKRQAQTAPGGVDGLGALLGQLGGTGLLDAVVGPQATPVDQGNAVLGSIFGSRDVSRDVAAHAAGQSGISAETLRRLLPVVAMLVAGYLSSRSQTSEGDAAPTDAGVTGGPGGVGGLGSLGGILGSVLGGGGAAGGSAGGGFGGGLGGMLGGVLGSVLGGGAAAPAAPAAPRTTAPGAGGLASILDLNGNGNPLDDILGMAGRLRG